MLAVRASTAATTVEFKATKKPSFPFVKLAGQEDMKLALALNVIDPNIGGVLIMGDRGTGKSVAVSLLTAAVHALARLASQRCAFDHGSARPHHPQQHSRRCHAACGQFSAAAP
jgi:Mg-chelatase subunit ChlI